MRLGSPHWPIYMKTRSKESEHNIAVGRASASVVRKRVVSARHHAAQNNRRGKKKKRTDIAHRRVDHSP